MSISPFAPYDHAARREKLRRAIADADIGGLLVSYAANRFYLSGFELHDPQCNESAGLLLIGRDGPEQDMLMTDPRYEDAAKEVWPEDQLFIYRNQRVEQIKTALKDWLHAHGRGKALGFEPQSVSYDFHAALSESVDLKPAGGMVEKLRVIKEPGELARMARSARLNHLVFACLPDMLTPGAREVDVAWKIEKMFREHGASEMAFSTIVGVGRNAAKPHAIPGEDKVADDLKNFPENAAVLVDTGARVNDYCSDQTRTFWMGEDPTKRFCITLELVQEAQEKAILAIRPGMTCQEAYMLAFKHFEEHGVAEHFTHGLGHGIGLETHEAPSLSSRSKTVLDPGMVVTVEPGLYYPEWGGVRWEYMCHITEDGAEPI